jgi:pyrroloquinoline quinone (PQQ) biosynthesis protein C
VLSHSERLCARIELALPTLVEITNEIVNHPRLGEILPEVFIRMHWVIRFTVPLMLSTTEACRQRAESDPVAAALLPYLEEHTEEERGHDELLLQDLERIGVPRAEVLRRLPSPCLAAAQGAIHYWAVHHHPIALFGSMVPSECYPTSLETIDWIQQQTGYPREAFRTMEMHSTLDQAHAAEALVMLDSLPLNDWHHEVLGVAALHFLAGTTQMYRELLDEFAE